MHTPNVSRYLRFPVAQYSPEKRSVTMFTDLDHTSPAALVLCGESFLKAAIHLDSAVRARDLPLRFEAQPVYALFRASLELVLAAYLKSRGYTRRRMEDERRSNPSIAKLVTICVAADCPMDDKLKQFVGRAATLLDDADRARCL